MIVLFEQMALPRRRGETASIGENSNPRSETTWEQPSARRHHVRGRPPLPLEGFHKARRKQTNRVRCSCRLLPPLTERICASRIRPCRTCPRFGRQEPAQWARFRFPQPQASLDASLESIAG